MHVGDLPLAPRFLEHFERQGFAELYPPQAAAVEAGVCEGESVLAAVPTASGKTFVAQLGMLTCEGPALYVVPLRALATEKADAFAELPGISVGVASGDYDATDEELADHDVVVATAEKVDAGIRHGASWVERVGCVALDEVHLLDQPSRGPTLEVTVAKLRRLNPDLQVVALSATVPNADAVADWLDAEVVHSEWRPVDLRRGVYAEGTLAFEDGAERVPGRPKSGEAGDGNSEADHEETELDVEASETDDDQSATATLVADALDRGGQCLVFVSSRRDARALAGELTMTLDGPLLPAPAEGERTDGSGGPVAQSDANTDGPSDASADRSTDADRPTAAIAGALEETAATPTGDALAELAADGVAFHHAGLRSEQRRIVEEGFRNGELGVLCATPTLAAGVNVPARRVVVRDHRRYGDDGYEPLSTLEVHQMFGRAGRPGLDPYGEAILVAEDDDEAEELQGRYLEDEPDPVTSKLDDPRALRPHVLASVASGLVDSRAELHSLLAETFYAHGNDPTPLVETAEAALDRLAEAGMLVETDDGGLSATDLGALVSHVYVDPGTGADVVAALERADDLERVTDLTVCEIVCDAEEMPSRYVSGDEAGALTDVALRRADELARPIQEFEGDFHAWLSSLKTARLLADYAAGTPLDELVEGYAVGPGDVRRYAERAQWLLAATESLAEHVDSDARDRIRETRERLEDRTG